MADEAPGQGFLIQPIEVIELGHQLLGPGSHSPTGIMSNPWHTTHLRLAAKGQLAFTKEQAQQIQVALRKRLGAEHASTDSRIPR